MISFCEVMDRAINTGPLIRVKDFDLKVFKVASRLNEEYGIRYDPKFTIPSDDDMADRLFEAAIKFYAEVGTYCIDTERVIKFTEEEIRGSIAELNRMPDEIEIGEGTEKRRMFKRGVGDTRKPIVIGGVAESNPIEGRDFVQMYKSIAQEKVIDGIYYGPAPRSIEGKKWTIGSPLEIQAARSAVGWVREALRSVGRPGLHLLDGCPSAVGTISACNPENGLRKTDAISLVNSAEMKVDFLTLNKVAYSLHYGCLRNPVWDTLVGGFVGGPEGCALVNVAAALWGVTVCQVGGQGYIGMPLFF